MPQSHENTIPMTSGHKEIFSSRDESIERIARLVVDAAFNVRFWTNLRDSL